MNSFELNFGVMLRYLCFLNFVCILVACHSQLLMFEQINANLTPRVVKGYKAALGDVPYQVSFKKPTDNLTQSYMTFCGGVIVGPAKLVSAAHCFTSKTSKYCTKGKCSNDSIILRCKELNQKFAVAGTLLNKDVFTSYNSPTGAQWRKLKSVFYPKAFKFPKDDIAVVITLHPFRFTSNVAPIPYATRFVDYIGECLVSGYGRTSLRKKIASDVLLIANIEVLPSSWCNQKYRNMNMNKFVCTVGKMSDVAQGDSGGPLVCSGTGEALEGSQGILVGIVSGHRVGVGSFFTRVSAHSKYITNVNNEANVFQLMYFYYYVIITVHYGFY